MIYVYPHFKTCPYSGMAISTTSNDGEYRELSPFVLRVPNPVWKRSDDKDVIFENLWQFSKVYKKHIMAIDGLPDASWYKWRDWGFSQDRAYRYPMGKGAIPEYSYWDGKKLGYIEARKKIYAPIYAKWVVLTKSYKRLFDLYGDLSAQGSNLILLDYDAYDHRKYNMTLKDVINKPKRKMGHAFVLMMLLTGELENCLK
jgi:hypothetical protein